MRKNGLGKKREERSGKIQRLRGEERERDTFGRKSGNGKKIETLRNKQRNLLK